ncbi:hypothetical protein [Nocardia pneumoniae]|uniref:hypothetical protein n=1 Tax=Nocardia pneumoniae TaxID=228601 RepID=UPI000594ED0C|nr:hypothetical protein [Nocardia pneumoniae]
MPAPQSDRPHWDAIVGDNWPVIGPGDWSALENLARDGASSLDLLDAEGRRRDFDERARSSEGLRPIKDDMLRQRAHPQAFADALEVVADTFGDFSDLVYRTQNQILDIYENAISKIDAKNRAAAAEEDESDAQAIRDRIPGIIAAAREDVDDVVRTALNSIPDLPSLPRLRDELGIGPSIPGQDGGPGDDYPQHRPAEDHSGAPHGGPPGPPGPEDVFPIGQFPGGDVPGDQPPVDPLVPGTELGQPSNPVPTENTPATPAPTGQTPVTNRPGPTTTPVGYLPGGVTGDGPDSPVAAGPARAPIAESEPADSGHDVSAEAADPDADAPESAVEGTESTTGDRSTTVSTAESRQEAGIESFAATATAATADPTASLPPPFLLPPPIAPPAAAAVSAPPPGSGVFAPAAQAGSGPPPIQAKPTAPPTDSRGPAVAPRVTAGPSAPPSGVSSGAVKEPQERTNQSADAAKKETEGSDELIRDAVGAAMTSAAAPAFVLGERVDGDLVLARTLLSGVLAAGGDAVVGLGWAVSVMRHQSGVNAFVTSNEGRGWLPAGLYLPREVSTPWVWEVSDGSGWEGVADPARVLAEFGLAWGRKSGARLTAVVSSGEIDADLRRQLGEVPMEGEVGASPAMDLSAPKPGLVDRLELVGAPALVQRAMATPELEIAWRCWELASDAHVRVHKAGLGSPAALGAPGVRDRILATLRQRREVPQEWWEELRDADDLLAASMLARRADVSRVALGELRTDDGRSASEMTALRAMVFERRCDELVLLLADAATRQSMRDAVYVHAQVVGHPAFIEPAAPASAGGPARRPTITAGPGR